MAWSFDDGSSIYAQIVKKIKMEILSGEYAPGQGLPSVRSLSAEAGVNPNTVQKSLKMLEEQKLVFPDSTTGRYVTKDKKHLEKVRAESRKSFLNELAKDGKKLGFTKEELCDYINKNF